MSFYLQIAFFQRFENNADTEGMKCLDDMVKDKKNTQKIVAEYDKLLRGPQSNYNASKISICRSRMTAEHEEDYDDDRYYFHYMKRYYED